jgi:transcriptional regulator with XRE-family HTH domain
VRARTSQSVVARIEQGGSDPSTATLTRLLAAAGFALRAELTAIAVADTHRLDDVARILALTPEERLLEVRNVSRFEAAARRACGRAARSGTARPCPCDAQRDNLEHLSAALRELEARVYTESVPEGLPFDRSAGALARAPLWNLVTNAGRLGLAFVPSGTEGFADLSRDAIRLEVFWVELFAASLSDIVRSKESADRPQDRQDVVLLREMLRRKGTMAEE